MNSFEGEVFVRSARSLTNGMRTATTGVLLITPAVPPLIPMTATSCLRSSSPVIDVTRSARRRMVPVRLIPSLRTNMARTVSVAGFENPATARSGVIVVHGSRTVRTTRRTIAEISTGIGSKTNRASVPTVIAKTTTISIVSDGGPVESRTLISSDTVFRFRRSWRPFSVHDDAVPTRPSATRGARSKPGRLRRGHRRESGNIHDPTYSANDRYSAHATYPAFAPDSAHATYPALGGNVHTSVLERLALRAEIRGYRPHSTPSSVRTRDVHATEDAGGRRFEKRSYQTVTLHTRGVGAGLHAYECNWLPVER